MDSLEVLIPIVFFLALGSVAIIYLTTKHRERMMMIEKGMTSEDIKALTAREMRRDPLTSLKWGILAMFVGMAILLGNYLHVQFHVDEGVMVGLVCLFAGLGLLIFYSIASKKIVQM